MKAVPKNSKATQSAWDAEITPDNMHHVLKEMGRRGIWIKLTYNSLMWNCELLKTVTVRGKQVHIKGISFKQETPCKAVDDSMKHFINQHRQQLKFEPEGYPELKILK